MQQQKAGQLSSVDLTTALYDAKNYKTRVNGNVLYADNNRISAAAAAELVKLIEVEL